MELQLFRLEMLKVKNGEYDNNYVWIFKFKDGLIHSLREYNSDLLVAERLYDYKLIPLD